MPEPATSKAHVPSTKGNEEGCKGAKTRHLAGGITTKVSGPGKRGAEEGGGVRITRATGGGSVRRERKKEAFAGGNKSVRRTTTTAGREEHDRRLSSSPRLARGPGRVRHGGPGLIAHLCLVPFATRGADTRETTLLRSDGTHFPWMNRRDIPKLQKFA